MYVITGSTGNTGKGIALALLKAGKKVRALGRDPNRLKELAALGAEPAVGNLGDGQFLRKAFAGATAVYAMVPPDFWASDYRGYQNRIADAMAEGVRANRVRHVVTLSSVGAHLPEKGGVVQGLHDMEQKFDRIDGTNVLHLRPTYFMENLLGQIDLIKKSGIMGSPIRADLKLPMVATRDIAEVGAKRLLALDFPGKSVQYLLGPRDVTFSEVAGILGRAIEKPDLKYIEFPYEEAKVYMMKDWGISESAAGAMVEFTGSLNEGRVLGDARRTPDSTTRTPIEEFTPIFARAYGR